MTKCIKNIQDLCPDEMNANRGTERGHAMIEDSLRQLGAGRSILVDKHGKVIAGNKTLESAANIGLDDIAVVQTDGKKLVVVQRTDLDLEKGGKARKLAIADNRTGQVSLDWDPNILAQLQEEDAKILEGLFRDDELAELLAKVGLLDVPEVVNDVEANTTKAGQYDKTKMPVNIGAVLFFLSVDEQQEISENMGVFYEDIAENDQVIELVKLKVGELADEIRALVPAD